jgi:hypothetical protein
MIPVAILIRFASVMGAGWSQKSGSLGVAMICSIYGDHKVDLDKNDRNLADVTGIPNEP